MTPAHVVTRAQVAVPAAASWIGPDLVSGEGIVSVDVTFLVRRALGEGGSTAVSRARPTTGAAGVRPRPDR